MSGLDCCHPRWTVRAVPGDRRAGRPSATHGGPSNEEGRRCAEPDPGRFLRCAARDSNPEPFALRVLVRGFLDLRRFIDVGSDLGVWLPLLSAVDPRLPVVRGPSAAPVYGMRRRGRRLGSRAVQARLTVGSLAPSASAQEAADQPKPNRYDDDIGKQCCLRHLSWVLLGCQRMSPIRPRPRTHRPVNELLADERDGEAMLQPAHRPSALERRSAEAKNRVRGWQPEAPTR